MAPWTVACQAPVSMEFSRQEYWSGLLFPIPDLPKGEGNPKKKKKKGDICVLIADSRDFPGGSEVKNLPIMQETSEDPLETEMASHSRILVWDIPWMEEPGGLQSMGLQELDVT